MPLSLEQIAKEFSDESDSDVYFYNGTIKRGADLRFIELVRSSKKKKNATLILVTSGGDPHAAYKIARYIQTLYETFIVLVSGLCKSAGTLIVVGAHRIVFGPYGELGPIDIQTYKIDHLTERQSGLTITESMEYLTSSAVLTHGRTFWAIMRETGAIISFKTAAQAASELVTGLYAPIFSQIDPMEVGEKARSMRIASDYGMRLDASSKNLQENALEYLTKTYPAHSFVIDMEEARSLFKDVQPLSEKGYELIDSIGFESKLVGHEDEPTFICLSRTIEEGGENEDPTDQAGDSSRDAKNSPATVEATNESIQNSKEFHPAPSEGNSEGRD